MKDFEGDCHSSEFNSFLNGKPVKVLKWVAENFIECEGWRRKVAREGKFKGGKILYHPSPPPPPSRPPPVLDTTVPNGTLLQG